MARPLRIKHEGAVYHVISKGNRGDHIFAEYHDKEYFIKTLQTAVEQYKIDLYAFCIMGNHSQAASNIAIGRTCKNNALHRVSLWEFSQTAKGMGERINVNNVNVQGQTPLTLFRRQRK
jgi:hypothetical protein